MDIWSRGVCTPLLPGLGLRLGARIRAAVDAQKADSDGEEEAACVELQKWKSVVHHLVHPA